MRRILVLVALAAVAAMALAAKPKLKDVFNPALIPLEPYAWPTWRQLPKEKRLATRGIDPDKWVTPPPDPLTPEELEKKKKKDEEEAKKTPEEKEKEKQKRINAPGPPDAHPGFKFDERLARKKRQFNTLAEGLPPSSIEGLIKKLPTIDKLAAKYDKLVAEHTEEYLKSKEQLDRIQKQAYDRYVKKHGKPPDDTFKVMVSRSLLQGHRRSKKRLQMMVAVQESEVQFHKWLFTRLAELVTELPEADRGKPFAALAAGMKHKDWRQRVRCATILGHLREDRSRAIFDAALASEADPYVLAELIRIRARSRPEGLNELLVVRLKDERWQVRAAVIVEFGRLLKKESVEILLAQLKKENGRLKDDIVDALEALTGERFDAEPEPWEQWWKKHKPTWKPPPPGGKKGAILPKAGKEGRSVSFYGIKTSSKHIVFCLDVSGSMNFPLDGNDGKKAPRIDTAKKEMLRALRMLPEDALFTIVSYSSGVDVWKKKLVKATPGNKKSATKYIEKLEPQGSTNIYDALEKSLQLAGGAPGKKREPQADTIFFMTDGVPTDGRVVDPAQILAEITQKNKRARVVIHTVGVSKEQNAAFLLNLARSNGGRYAARK
ncbi:MAG: VWA domain-containing protein [Planctomycetota bacterium]|jgi:plasmid stability protein/uncharacterized protein YegL